MDISVGYRSGEVVWVMKGDLDFEGARAVRAAAKSCRGSSRHVVDLSGVPFVDSAGLAALIGLSRRATEAGGSLVVTGAQRSILRLLRITEVDRRLEIHPPLDLGGGAEDHAGSDVSDVPAADTAPAAPLQVTRW